MAIYSHPNVIGCLLICKDNFVLYNIAKSIKLTSQHVSHLSCCKELNKWFSRLKRASVYERI